MTDYLYIDIETRSRVDLKKYPVYRYAECPDFEILMAAYALNDEPVRLAIGEDAIKAIPGLWDDSVVKVAHNAQFERVCLSRLAGLPVGEYLDPFYWLDTAAIAAEKGWPSSLDFLAKALGGEQKDSAGTLLINYFCKPNRKGEFNTPESDLEKWMDFGVYCVQDVETHRDVHKMIGGFPTKSEHLIWIADQKINDNGIKMDVALAETAKSAAETNQLIQEMEISGLTGITNPGSVTQLMSWFKDQGVEMSDMTKDSVAATLKRDDLTDTQRRVLELRQELALVASKKFEAALNSVSPDGRIRGMFRFFGAHTGRWSSKGVQVHNLARGFETDADTDLAVLDLMLTGEASAQDLKNLVRPMFMGPLVVSDYSAIEARVLAWLAGEEWVLEAFRNGRDIYVETANRMGGGMGRREGKIATLALGYQGAVNALLAMGGSAIGDDEMLMTIVHQWRRANPNIVALWARMQEAFWHGGPVGARLSVEVDGDVRSIKLPSGRSLVYRDVKQVMETTESGRKRPVLTFKDPKTGFRAKTYGGRLVENVTQAVARDIMAVALSRLTAAGHKVVGHVHDEILVEVDDPRPGDIATIEKMMCALPAWGRDFPIGAEGFTTNRYRKG